MKREERKSRNIRMTDHEWEVFKALLGAEWLRYQIAKADKSAGKKS